MSSKEQQLVPGDAVVLETDTKTMTGEDHPVSDVYYSCPVAPGQHAEEYNMAHARRGVALIFNHSKFKEGVPRNGTHVDCTALAKALKDLGFEVEEHHDFTCKELKKKLNEVASTDHTDADCLLIAVLTHGEETVLHTADEPYAIQQLWNPFLGDKCPTLAGKPKIFIIQACRGALFDDGVRVRTETDGSHGEYTIPIHSDILVAYATPYETDLIEEDLRKQKPDKPGREDGDETTTTASPDTPPSNDVSLGHYSWRNPSEGSWFIQALVEEFKLNGRKRDLQTLLTFVARRVAVEKKSRCADKSMKYKKQAPVFTSSLTRLVFFR